MVLSNSSLYSNCPSVSQKFHPKLQMIRAVTSHLALYVRNNLLQSALRKKASVTKTCCPKTHERNNVLKGMIGRLINVSRWEEMTCYI